MLLIYIADGHIINHKQTLFQSKGDVHMKNWFKKFIKKLEEANKESFGNERLDCCAVNKKSKGSPSK